MLSALESFRASHFSILISRCQYQRGLDVALGGCSNACQKPVGIAVHVRGLLSRPSETTQPQKPLEDLTMFNVDICILLHTNV